MVWRTQARPAATEPLQLNADTVRLSQAFSNLLNNACKYTHPGGHISLTAVRENGQIVVSIRDNGMGIPTDLSPKIFEMFTQANHNIQRQHGGLGIGLALVKRLVEMHEGEVSAGANPAGQGSEFLVKLPLMTIPNANESSTSSSTDPTTGEAPLRILVVDDNRDSAETLSMLLELMGNEITVAYDGEQALALANEIKPDVMLLDIGLPKIDGYDVARRIRQEPWGSNPILVAITGWGQTEDKDLSRESGFDHHLVKPVDHDHLLKIIQKHKI